MIFITEENPDWFENTANITRRILIEKARKGEDRPHFIKDNKLWSALRCYTVKSSTSFNDTFNNKIRNLRPDWFVNTSKIKKVELLTLATGGKNKPRTISKDKSEAQLGKALHSYLSTFSNCYDEEFSNKIKELAPQWFINTAENMKKRLIELAMGKGKRPCYRAKDEKEKRLGIALSHYTSLTNNSYDEEFKQKIEKLSPHWFNKVENKKKKIIDIAKSGGKRPYNFSENIEEKRLGEAIAHYLNKNGKSYDIDFHNELRKLRPDWFIKRNR